MKDRSRLRKRFAALDALGAESASGDLAEAKRARGRDFEKLIAELFELEDL